MYSPRRDFQLIPEDQAFLDKLNFCWSTIRDKNSNWLLIHEYPIPPGYSQEIACVALQIIGDYSTSGIDMFYFSPSLSLKSGKQINCTNCFVDICGTQYQRWSRHKQWRAGVDSLETHLLAMDDCLANEGAK